MITGRLGLLITAYLVLTNMTAAAMSFNSPVFTAIDAWDELYKNRSSRKTDSQKEKRSSGSPKWCSIKKVLRENLTAVHRRTAIQQKILGATLDIA